MGGLHLIASTIPNGGGVATRLGGSVAARPLWAVLALLSALIATRECRALPAGKTWAPAELWTRSGYYYLAAPRLDFETGSLRAATLPRGPNRTSDAVGYRWSESQWVETWKLGHGTLIFWPVLAPEGETHLIWQGATSATTNLLEMATVEGDSLGVLETVAVTWRGARSEYAAAVGKTRRWAAVGDDSPTLGARLRLFVSDHREPWREIEVTGGGGRGVTIGEVNDSTALVVWSDAGSHLKWGFLRGEQWDPRGVLFAGGWPERPRFRKRPGGGLWLTWGDLSPDVHIARYDRDTWSIPIAITANYSGPPHDQNFAEDTDMSRDQREYPVIAWDYFNPLQPSSEQIVVVVPEGGIYGRGECVPGSQGGVLPSLARDDNGDVWVSWWQEFRATLWTHTYTRARVAKLALREDDAKRTVLWLLDEPAPESWWTVLRARKGEGFEEAGRIQAGEGLEMSWIDADLRPEQTRYKIRRDCLDARYRWESAEVVWPPLSAPVTPPRSGPTLKPPIYPIDDEAIFEVRNVVAGEVELAILDLQGRQILSRRLVPSSEGKLQFSLAASGTTLGAGIYFARVRDASGTWSTAARVVVLK